MFAAGVRLGAEGTTDNSPPVPLVGGALPRGVRSPRPFPQLYFFECDARPLPRNLPPLLWTS